MRRISVSADEDYVDRVDDRRESTTSRAQWFRGAGKMRLEIEEAVESSAMDGELDEDWWRDWLYNAAREELDKREQQMVAEQRAERDEQEIEA